MRILISGAAGFLGSHLSDLLLSQGNEVVGVDNLITGKRQNIAHLRGDPNFTFIEHDVIEPLEVGGDISRTRLLSVARRGPHCRAERERIDCGLPHVAVRSVKRQCTEACQLVHPDERRPPLDDCQLALDGRAQIAGRR